MSHEVLPSKRDVQISKAMSYLLRHGALKEKLPIDRNGFVPIEVLLRHNRLKSHKCTLEDIHRIVANNDKKRFQVMERTLNNEESQEVIRATQGHSIKAIDPEDDFLRRITDVADLPDKLIHGTSISKLLLILQSGSIKRQNRNHIHLSPGVSGVDTTVVSGMRSSSNVHIYLNLNQELLDQLQLFKSLNNVYLTPNDINVSLFKIVKIRPPKRKENAIKDLERTITELDKLGIPYDVTKDIETINP